MSNMYMIYYFSHIFSGVWAQLDDYKNSELSNSGLLQEEVEREEMKMLE